ncbi:hypothetical protein KJY77_00715 [Canibacter sp. lx-72]|uniref:hypothetical protein n=1 Tax=Canibacter zhuwentaonis TaxID=2837491 RepID=UPI001BDD39FF|nr:hypothetical protein [Canibacter zhuwentaonis]MBT1017669.1 hypothetical protein [Canibacter zhuwentaonis]
MHLVDSEASSGGLAWLRGLSAQIISFRSGLALVAQLVWYGIYTILHGVTLLNSVLMMVVRIGGGSLILWGALLAGDYIFDRIAPKTVSITEIYD